MLISSHAVFASAITLALAASSTSATFLSNPFARRAECGVYTIITTRGTGEPQGPSVAFVRAISDTLRAVPGGSTYDAVYAAEVLQQSEPATVDVLNKIKTTLEQCPSHKFALLGYSQGATATTEVLTRADDTVFNAVSACVLVGNPRHNKDLQSNFDTNGGRITAEGTGLFSALAPIPARWDESGKVLDICAPGDGICAQEGNKAFGPEHGTYATSDFTQSRSAALMIDAFKAAAAAPSSSASASSSSSTTRASSSSSSTSASSTVTPTSASAVSPSSPSATGRPQADAAMSQVGSTNAVLVTVAALGFGALLAVA